MTAALADLFNPYHDRWGRFASADHATITRAGEVSRREKQPPSVFAGEPVADAEWITQNVTIEGAHAAELAATLAACQLPRRFLARLTRLSSDTPEGYELDTLTGTFIRRRPHSYWPAAVGIAGLQRDHAIHGVEASSIYIAPACVTSRATLIHEIGHHVSWLIAHSGPDGGPDSPQYRALERLDYLTRVPHTRNKAKMGLRAYSFTNGSELYADTFLVAHAGSAEQQQHLARWLFREMYRDMSWHSLFAIPEGERLNAPAEFYNPHHDAKGRFASASSSAAPAAQLPYRPDPEVLEGVRKLIRRGFLLYQRDDKDFAGLSDAEMEAKIVSKMREMAANPLAIRRHDRGALGVLRDGRFKTQFETHTSSGLFDPKYRKDAEELGLGVPRAIDPKLRPVYGYIDHGEDDNVAQYGPVEFRLKETVKDRATMTLDDSLGNFADEMACGTPVRAPQIEGADGGYPGLFDTNSPTMIYVEAQIHGGVTLADVDKVILHREAFYAAPASGAAWDDLHPAYQDIVAELQRLGIQVEYDPTTD